MLCSNEALAPLVVAFPFDDFDDALRQVNDSFYGLQTGVFTNDLAHSWLRWSIEDMSELRPMVVAQPA